LIKEIIPRKRKPNFENVSAVINNERMTELKNIFREATAKTPQVDFNCLTGDLILHGRSIPENANGFYEPLAKWINEYIANPRPTTNLRLNLEYFNTASSLWLSKIVKNLSRMRNNEHLLLIHLYFSAEDFDEMDSESIRDDLEPILDIVSAATVSIGIKVYATNEKGEIIRESMVLL